MASISLSVLPQVLTISAEKLCRPEHFSYTFTFFWLLIMLHNHCFYVIPPKPSLWLSPDSYPKGLLLLCKMAFKEFISMEFRQSRGFLKDCCQTVGWDRLFPNCCVSYIRTFLSFISLPAEAVTMPWPLFLWTAGRLEDLSLFSTSKSKVWCLSNETILRLPGLMPWR